MVIVRARHLTSLVRIAAHLVEVRFYATILVRRIIFLLSIGNWGSLEYVLRVWIPSLCIDDML